MRSAHSSVSTKVDRSNLDWTLANTKEGGKLWSYKLTVKQLELGVFSKVFPIMQKEEHNSTRDKVVPRNWKCLWSRGKTLFRVSSLQIWIRDLQKHEAELLLTLCFLCCSFWLSMTSSSQPSAGFYWLPEGCREVKNGACDQPGGFEAEALQVKYISP